MRIRKKVFWLFLKIPYLYAMPGICNFYFWFMIPKYQFLFLYLILIFVIAFSCQEAAFTKSKPDISTYSISENSIENVSSQSINSDSRSEDFIKLQNELISLKLLINNSKDNEFKENVLRYMKLNDSINKVQLKEYNQLAAKSNSKAFNLKLAAYKTENELQLERQRNRTITSYIIIGFTLSLVLALYFYFRSRTNKEKIEAAYQSEIRIAKKLHDELANDIFHTMAFAENKNLSEAENKEHLLNNLEAIYTRTRDISKENSLVVTNEKFVIYLKEMISGFNTSNINLLINGLDSISWNRIEKNKKITVYRVLQELLVNMKKHSQATLAGINFKEVNKKIMITYTDNGKGVAIQDLRYNNGLQSVENRIQNIRGEIIIDTNPGNGFKLSFKFPS